jgi:hypothetical protein
MQRTTESIASRTEAPAGAIKPAEWRAHLDRARELRAEFIAGLLRRGLGGIVQLLRRIISAPRGRKPTRRPGCGGLMPLDPPAAHHGACPIKESRHVAGSNRAA